MIQVAVGVLRAPNGQVLVAQRPSGGHLAGLWEFPGGKREPGEARVDALARELREEIGIFLTHAEPLIRITHHYPERSVELDVWEVTAWEGVPHSGEGQPIEWVEVQELESRAMPPADQPIVRAIRLPHEYLITPEPDLASPQRYLEQLSRCLGRGVRLVQIRVKSVPEGEEDSERLEWLLREANTLASHAGAQLVLNVPPEYETRAGNVSGLHLSGSRLATLGARPDISVVGASCHDARELERAAHLGVDFAVLGSVMPTATHPGGPVLGWERFEALANEATLPVYALGGMGRGDVREARERGAQGIAAIRALWELGRG